MEIEEETLVSEVCELKLRFNKYTFETPTRLSPEEGLGEKRAVSSWFTAIIS